MPGCLAQLNIDQQYFRQNRSLVCAGTDKGPARLGIVGGHAYSVFGVLDEDPDTDRPRLIKLRNPWGREDGEWAGAWSKEWLSRNLKECSELETGPGEFFMDLHDFRKHFSLLTFCLNLTNSWTERRRKSELTPISNRIEFKLELEERADTMISFSQMGRRQVRDVTRPAATFLNIRICLLDSEDVELVGDQYGKLRTKTVRKILTAGTYWIICEAEWVDRMTPTFLRVASLCETFSLTKSQSDLMK